MTVMAYSIRDLEFSYSVKPDLFIRSLDIPTGKVVAVVGPNGSGKTTLLHLLAFILIPQKGSISLLGQDFMNSEIVSFRRKVGLLSQNPYLFKSSVIENVKIGLKLRKFPANLSDTIARDALHKVGLEKFEDRRAGSLSGGEAQRVALARTLALKPEILLFDEPANHLDTESVKRIEQIIMVFKGSQDKTVVFATHNLNLAEELADEVIHIFEGHVMPGPPFNLFRGRVVQGGAIFDSGLIKFDIPDACQSGSTILIDPRKIAFSIHEEFSGMPNVFQGMITSLSISRNRLKIRVAAGELFEVHSEFTQEHKALGIGEKIWLQVRPDIIDII